MEQENKEHPLANLTLEQKEAMQQEFLLWRGIQVPYEKPCRNCGGTGKVMYGNTSGWRGGVGGCAMTLDVCDQCWGSGTPNRPGADLRKLEALQQELVRVKAMCFRAAEEITLLVNENPSSTGYGPQNLLNGLRFVTKPHYSKYKHLADGTSRTSGEGVSKP